MTLTISSPMTIVNDESIVEETSVHLKSTDTSGSSQTERIPFSSLSALSLNAAFTSSAKDFDKRGKAVSGARSIADDGFIWVVSISIDTNHIGWDVSFARCCDEYLLSTCLNVLPCTFSVHKDPSSFDHQVDP
ncbi:hypothetical protein Lal_00021324 [Lupinus albus]|nr:hypothetical protein Lal_00021324 [Lupinus albus]